MLKKCNYISLLYLVLFAAIWTSGADICAQEAALSKGLADFALQEPSAIHGSLKGGFFSSGDEAAACPASASTFPFQQSDDCTAGFVGLELGPSTQKALSRLQKTDYEIGYHDSGVSEMILNCSYLQDILFAFLHEAESLDEYYKGMQLFQTSTPHFQSVCRYITSVFNFYTGDDTPPKPERLLVSFKGKPIWGFLNTFKMGRNLSSEERLKFYSQEYAKYLEDGIVKPFILDRSTINDLEVGRVYNFVLLSDGRINVALERPGDKEYQICNEVLVEAFTYPNHTILAGDPQQVVLSAGALILHQEGNKRLLFISCKSGHFQPDYGSLDIFRSQLAELGINPSVVVPVPDVDMSRAVIKIYNGAKVPVLLTKHDTERLFKSALERWGKTYREIDFDLIAGLARGETGRLGPSLTELLKRQRAESTYMRSAYRLFSSTHEPSGAFSEFVKHFGKLKDAVKRYGTHKFKIEKVQEEACAVLELVHGYGHELAGNVVDSADDLSFFEFLSGVISEAKELLSRENLTLKEYHEVKKISRELGALFQYMALDVEGKGKGFLIYRTAAEGFFQINDLMAQTDYTYAESDASAPETRVIVSRKIGSQLTRHLSHLGVAPPSIQITVDPVDAYWMIHYAKEVYFISKQVRRVLMEIEEGVKVEESFDFAKFASQLKTLERFAGRARNILVFLDVRHAPPAKFDMFMESLDKMIDAAEREDFGWIESHAKHFQQQCYYVPSSGLEYWQCTDQESFDGVLGVCLSHLYDIKSETLITACRAEEIARQVQAFRDLVNLIRRNGLNHSEQDYPSVPIVCFDALEEHAEALLSGFENVLYKNAQALIINDAMAAHASFILHRIGNVSCNRR